jgi:phenylacetate-CoA ligase
MWETLKIRGVRTTKGTRATSFRTSWLYSDALKLVSKASFRIASLMGFPEMLSGIHEAKTILKAAPKKIEAIAQRRLQFIISEAYRKVPFYSKTFRSIGITPADIKAAADLQKLPILKRSDVLENPTQMLNVEFQPNQCMRITTSGSTGQPVVCLFDPKAWYHLEGIALRGQFQGGLRLRHRVAVVVIPRSIALNKFYRSLSRFGRMRYASVFDDVETILSSLVTFRPHVLKTYPSFLRSAIEIGAPFHCPLVFSQSEDLEEGLRRQVEAAFNAKLINLYGAVESTSIAWECRVSSLYHIDADSVVVEAVKLNSDSPANPGEPARVLITGLLNRAMPLIRYELGDIVVLSDDECNCGVKLPLMTRIEGRKADCIRLPTGRLISPYTLTDIVRHINAIRQFQIIQEERNKISVKIVPRPGFENKVISDWLGGLQEVVGENVKIEPQVVDSISMERREKHRYVISKVS